MTENDSNAQPVAALSGDSGRRASSTVRGYLYQFWRTVEAWIELGPDDLLFVEGAEDYDVVTVDQGTAVQVKDNKASGPLTLTNSGAHSAVNNYWSLRQNNPGRRIHFKFVTTAAAGAERPGFDGDKGIEIWNLCRHSPLETCLPDIERIRTFLQKKKSFGNELLQFLKIANPECLKQDLIEPIEWIFDQPGLQGMEEIVTGRLLDLGSARGLTARDATELAEHLCLVVVRGATEDIPKQLDFAGLRSRLDQAVNIEVPRETLRRMERADVFIESLLANSLDPGQKLPTITSAPDAFAPPVLASNVWPRQSLIDRVRSSMEAGIVYLVGGAGIGKTTLVLHALNPGESIFWVSLRDRTTQEFRHVCRALRQRVAKTPNIHVILDDLNPTDDPRNLEHDIGMIAAAVRKRAGVLIITSYTEAGPRLAAILGLKPDNVLNVPAFDENEVRDFLQDAGCPENVVKVLSRIVWVHTSGHPQLVAARVSTLKAGGFPKPTADDFLDQPMDIKDAQAEARVVVRAMADDARRLLYRLSIPLPPLRRAHILGIAASDPPIALAGEIFDTVVGPWFQEVAPGHYRISPLLSKAGEQVLSRDEIKRLNANIATSILAEGTLTPSEFSGVLMHALLGEAESIVAIASNAFITAPRSDKKALAEDLTWVPAVGLGPDTRLPLSNRTVRQMFRLVQWEIAGLAAPSQLEPIAVAMDKEFAGDTTELVEILPRILYLSKLLLQKDFSVPVADVVSHTLEIKRLTDIAHRKDSSIKIADGIQPIYKNAPRPKLAGLFTVAIMPRIRTVADLRALIEALDSPEEDDRNWLLAGLAVEDGELRILFNSIWLSITKGDKKEYEAYEQALACAIVAGRRWGIYAWMRAAARTRSAVIDETLGRRSDAENAVTEIADEIGTSFNLEEQLAVIAFNRKDYDIALPIWERVLPQWHSDNLFHDMQPVFGLRCAAISASKLGRWSDAAAFYDQAISRGKKFDQPGWSIGLRADRAYALWIARDFPAALQLFTDVVADLQTLPNKPDSFAEYAIQKLIGHTLSTLADPSGPLSDYVPGMCSDLSPHKDISTLPQVPVVFTWYLLHQLAAQAGDKALASDCADKIRNAPFAFLRAMAALDRVERALESDDLYAVPDLAAVFAVEMEKSARRDDQPIYAADPNSLAADLTTRSMNAYARPALWAAVLRAKALKRNIPDLIQRWTSAIDLKHSILVDELSFLAQFAGASVAELGRILKDQDQVVERRIWASVFLTGNDEASLLDAVYAHVTLISEAKAYNILWSVGGPSFDELLRKDWQRFSKATFLLRNPRVHVDSIQAECNSNAYGWSAAARIILAWNPATELRLPNDILDTLRRLAADTSGDQESVHTET